jgi:hypothetical protein
MLIADCHIDSIPVDQLRRNLEIVNRELHARFRILTRL